MTCERCGAELTEDPRLGPVSANGRPTCPRGGPHKLASVAEGLEAWLRDMA